MQVLAATRALSQPIENRRRCLKGSISHYSTIKFDRPPDLKPVDRLVSVRDGTAHGQRSEYVYEAIDNFFVTLYGRGNYMRRNSRPVSMMLQNFELRIIS